MGGWEAGWDRSIDHAASLPFCIRVTSRPASWAYYFQILYRINTYRYKKIWAPKIHGPCSGRTLGTTVGPALHRAASLLVDCFQVACAASLTGISTGELKAGQGSESGTSRRPGGPAVQELDGMASWQLGTSFLLPNDVQARPHPGYLAQATPAMVLARSDRKSVV